MKQTSIKFLDKHITSILYIFLFTTGIISIIYPWLTSTIKHSLKNIVTLTGYTSLGSFVLLLSLSPLIRAQPDLHFLQYLNQFRRILGLASFEFALIHVYAVIAKSYVKKRNFLIC